VKDALELPAVSCSCWEAEMDSAEVDALLAEKRRKHPKAIIQVVGAARAPNARMVEMMAAQTLMAVKSGAKLAERPELDLLLRLAGTRQIGEAFRRMGYKAKGKRLFLVAASERDAGISRLRAEIAKDRRFTPVEGDKLAPGDLEKVEAAALLAVRL
jgi:tRNA threonylcarbamoyladenosine modification (KEOPS) complex Cgi121 subunit